MRTHVEPEALGSCARRLSSVAADLSDARDRLGAVHVSCAADLGRAGAGAEEQTWAAAARALSTVADGVSRLGDALRLLACVYDDVERTALR